MISNNKLDSIDQLFTQAFLKGEKYYHVILKPLSNGGVGWQWQSKYVGHTKKTSNLPAREKRRICEVHPENMRTALRSLGEPPMTINSISDFLTFSFMGGHGIIRKTLFEQCIPEYCDAKTSVISYTDAGYMDVDSKPRDVVRHRKAQGETREAVLVRDKYQCKLCGKALPDASQDRQVHHIDPWNHGGLTEVNNLITLCTSCHLSLGDEVHIWLYERIGLELYSTTPFCTSTYFEDMVKVNQIARNAVREEFPFWTI